MSDTPRTDAEDFYPHHSNKKVCDADFARQLERELNAANESFRKLNIHTLNLVDRIRRLEETGDEAIYPFEYAARVRIWNEAKEVKP